MRGQQVTLKWAQTPVRYFVSDSGVPGVTAADFQNAVGRAFATWQAVPTASITYQFAGVTRRSPGATMERRRSDSGAGPISIACWRRRAFWSTRRPAR